MSDITANIVVQSFGANIAVEENNINITPTDIQLRVFAGGYATAGGNINDVQYNNGGIIAGDAGLKYYPGNTTAVANNLTVTNNSNLGQATAGNLYANTGTVGASLLTGTLTTAAQPNVTSVGTLGTLTVTGNVTGNYFIGNGSQLTGLDSTSNGNSNIRIFANSNVAVSVGGNSNIAVVTDTGVNIAGYLNATGNVTFAGPNISVGNVSNLKITGGSNSYFLQTDGTGNLTWAAGTANVTGNGTAAGANTQIQISNGAGGFTSGAGFTFDNASNLFSAPGNGNFAGNVTANYFIGNGSQLTGIVNSDTIQNGNSNVTIAANANVTISVSGVANIATVTSNSLIVNGNITSNNANAGNLLTANFITGTITTNAQPNITSVGNLTGLTVNGSANISGDVTANTFIGNISGIFANGNSNVRIPAANGNINLSAAGTANVLVVTGTGANVTGTLRATGNANVANIGATNGVFTSIIGGLLTNSQPNITTIGTLSNLTVTGNVTAGNLTGANLISGNFVTGTLTTAAQPNITSVGNLSGLVVNGNMTLAGNIFANTTSQALYTRTIYANGYTIYGSFQGGSGNFTDVTVTGTLTANAFAASGISNGTSNVRMATSGGNITMSVGGSANRVVISTTSANIQGIANITGNAEIGGNLSVVGSANSTTLNVSGNAITGNLFTNYVDTDRLTLPYSNSNAAAGTTQVHANNVSYQRYNITANGAANTITINYANLTTGGNSFGSTYKTLIYNNTGNSLTIVPQVLDVNSGNQIISNGRYALLQIDVFGNIDATGVTAGTWLFANVT